MLRKNVSKMVADNLEILETLEILEFPGYPGNLGNPGNLEMLEILEIVESLEIEKQTGRNPDESEIDRFHLVSRQNYFCILLNKTENTLTWQQTNTIYCIQV